MSNRSYTWTGGEETHAYDDLLFLPHYVSPTRPRMSLLERAAQFSPFDALEGYGDDITETARTTSSRDKLSETQLDSLDLQFRRLRDLVREAAHEHFLGNGVKFPEAAVTYFSADRERHRHSKKSGGMYLRYTGRVRRIEEAENRLIFEGENKNSEFSIKLENITNIEIHEKE